MQYRSVRHRGIKRKGGKKGMIQESIVKLVQYGLATGLVEKEDKRYTTNKILELLQMDAIDEEYVKQILESCIHSRLRWCSHTWLYHPAVRPA